MFKTIMLPVDLAHIAHLERSIAAASMLAKANDAEVILVSISSAAPSEVARTPEQFAAKLAGFARQVAETHGVRAQSRAYITHDPASDLDATLLQAVHDTGADLVVMASHLPTVVDRFWPSNGGTIARRADVSVFVVR